MDEVGVLRLKEAAEFVRVSEKTLREMAKAGRIPCQRVGREWRFLTKALESWLTGERPAREDSGQVAELRGQLYLPISDLNIKPSRAGFSDTAFTKNREEPVHSWIPWIAGFSASFVAEILEREMEKSKMLRVLDPFAGVGTTLVEGFKRNCDVFGFEINPYAALACQVKLDAFYYDPDTIRSAARRLQSFLRENLQNAANKPRSEPPFGFRSRDPFFSPKVEPQVLYVKDFIREEKKEWLQRVLRIALGAVIVSVSNYTYEPSLGRRTAVGKDPIIDADLSAILYDKLFKMARDIEILQAGRVSSERQPLAHVFNESYLTSAAVRLGPSSMDILITSPPYLNNYHYVRNTRPQLFWLDFTREASELRDLETSSFGKFWQTVRSEPEVPLIFKDSEIEKKLEELRSLRTENGPNGGPGWTNYAATYFNDCKRFCEVTANVMKPGGLVVVVIGNNILQGVEFKTDEIFAGLAERVGFVVEGLHVVRKRRTGSSIINSSVRIGQVTKRTDLYEKAVELRLKRSPF